MSTDHNHFEEKGQPKRNRAEALLLPSLTPYRWAKLATDTLHKSKPVALRPDDDKVMLNVLRCQLTY